MPRFVQNTLKEQNYDAIYTQMVPQKLIFSFDIQCGSLISGDI